VSTWIDNRGIAGPCKRSNGAMPFKGDNSARLGDELPNGSAIALSQACAMRSRTQRPKPAAVRKLEAEKRSEGWTYVHGEGIRRRKTHPCFVPRRVAPSQKRKGLSFLAIVRERRGGVRQTYGDNQWTACKPVKRPPPRSP